MIQIAKQEFEALPKYDRTRLINSLSGFQPVHLMSTVSADNKTNLTLLNSVMHIGASPALMGFIQRPNTVQRDGYSNLKDGGYFAFNWVDSDLKDRAHQSSARYEGISEFEACAIEPSYDPDFPELPLVAEAPVQIILKFAYEHVIPLNQTILVVGSVEKIRINEGVLRDDFGLDTSTFNPLTVLGLEEYASPGATEKKAYAKP